MYKIKIKIVAIKNSGRKLFFIFVFSFLFFLFRSSSMVSLSYYSEKCKQSLFKTKQWVSTWTWRLPWVFKFYLLFWLIRILEGFWYGEFFALPTLFGFFLHVSVGCMCMAVYLVLLEHIYEAPDSINQEVVGALPIYYRPEYNIQFFGVEKILHAFEGDKYKKVYQALLAQGGCVPSSFSQAPPLPTFFLSSFYPLLFLKKLSDPRYLSEVFQVSLIQHLPLALTDHKILRPMRYATSGTIWACQRAFSMGDPSTRKWSINLGGGYHHASQTHAEGFCLYADITMALSSLKMKYPSILQHVCIIDLDAHQGQGYARDKQHSSVFKNLKITIVDIFHQGIYPNDIEAQKVIEYPGHVQASVSNTTYMNLVRERVFAALSPTRHSSLSQPHPQPQFILYVAGTDIIEGDPIGGLHLQPDLILERDEFVFRSAFEFGIPITMVLAGGYTSQSASLVARSILNLRQKFGLW